MSNAPSPFAPPHSELNTSKSSRRWAVVLASLFFGAGAGHVPIGKWQRAACWYAGQVTMGACMVFAAMKSYPLLALLLLVVSAGIYVAGLVDALKRAQSSSPLPSWLRVAPILIALVVLGKLQTRGTRHVVESFEVPADSMAPTLLTGDHFLIDKTSDSPERGDVVLFAAPMAAEVSYIKRVVAVAGDNVKVEGQTLIVNGSAASLRPLADASFGDGGTAPGKVYEEASGQHAHEIVIFRPEGADFGPVTVPPGKLFVLGDNRDNSSDSRTWGMVPVENVKGRALFVWSSVSPEGAFRWDRMGKSIH